ncbi:MAG: solute carrier family 23 protein [candidate division KSB1 bacterium]|nr:solute carrier family 23 protein [candidate division KSB1 bacterium]
MNRGIFAEGLGSALAAVFGGLPCTSYTQNIGIIATTRVASRFVVQIAAVILQVAVRTVPQITAPLLVAMPRSVLGGVFIIVCGMIVLSGIRLLAAADVSPQPPSSPATTTHRRQRPAHLRVTSPLGDASGFAPCRLSSNCRSPTPWCWPCCWGVRVACGVNMVLGG